jgi:hypothetical protein
MNRYLTLYYIVPKKLREGFLKLGEKLGVSEQARTDKQGYYYNLIKAGYDPRKIEKIPVNFNGTSATMPLSEKRLNYIKRHAHEDKVKDISENGTKYEVLTRSAMADLFWAWFPLNLPDKARNILLKNTLKYYGIGCGCGCNGENMKYKKYVD